MHLGPIPEEQYVGEGTEEPVPLAPHARYRDAETITGQNILLSITRCIRCTTVDFHISLWVSVIDVCNSTELPEVEIISLLEEQLPVYRLRADSVYGYEHDDWIHTPLISPDTRIDLTSEQIEETLNYFCESEACYHYKELWPLVDLESYLLKYYVYDGKVLKFYTFYD